MKKIFTIAVWEFLRYLKTRSFLVATFVSPIVLAGIIIIPSFFYQQSQFTKPQIIGVVEIDSTNYQAILSKRFNDSLNSREKYQEIILKKIEADTSQELSQYLFKQSRLEFERDSLDEAYNQIKERRKYIFQRPASTTREQRLRDTYAQLHQTREARDLAVIEYNRMKSLTDSLLKTAVFKTADSLLITKTIQGYIVIEPMLFKNGKIEFHSLLPINFFRIDRLKQNIQELLVEERMRGEGITSTQIQKWLEPIEFEELRLEGSEKREFNIIVTYLGPIIVVLFLFISIFTESGFLYNSIIQEKSNYIIEFLLSSVKSTQIILGKITGLGVLGLFQVLIWMVVTALLVYLNVIPSKEIGFLTLENGLIFIVYFILGYLFISTVFIGVGSLFSSEENARQFNQVMRILSIFPIILAVLVLESPNSLIVRILSFIPILTPSFMILRTPLGQPPQIDYVISVIIMLVFITITLLFAIRVFKVGSYIYDHTIGLKEIFTFIKRNRKK
jgi:ABC-2 type transport system permease protein